jgi:hypothetical protein
MQYTEPRRRTSLAMALAGLLSAGHAHAVPVITAVVTDLGGSFRYDYTIDNRAGGEDIALVDINVPAFDATLTHLFAPAGFAAVYTDFLGKVTFLPQAGVSDLFAAGQSLRGFGFESARRLGPSTFEALTVSGELLRPDAAVFRRGDATADGRVDISDPIRILGYLFQGGNNPIVCQDAADADDSGSLEITDPIYILHHIFLRGPPPPPPGIEHCGEDPSADELAPCEYPGERC